MWRLSSLFGEATRSRALSIGGLGLLASVVVAVSAGPVSAQDKDTLHVEVDKAHLIQLDENAATVMIADPTVADVTVESPRLVFVIGRAVGETSLFILDAGGNRMVDSNIIVDERADPVEAEPDTPAPVISAAPAAAKPKEREVTVFRNVTSEETLSCEPVCGAGDDAGGGAGGGGKQKTGGTSSPTEIDLDPSKSRDVTVPLK
jgi:hypothetical protein